MKYTKYFSFIVKENGQPLLEEHQFRLMMNIIFLEGVISGLNKSKAANKGTDQYYKYDIILLNVERELSELTGNLKPSDLLYKMHLNT